MLLGVESSQLISRKKFGDRASIDLMTVLFPSGQAQKLKEVCRMLGIVPPVGYEMSGDKVFDYVEAGRWQEVADYVESDAVIEFELYQRLSDYVLF
jgi:predicted PolB exonuclease-like 3'-5' exonuclease